MKTINRTAITIISKQPYIDWANSFENGAGDEKIHATTILIPDKYGQEKYIKKIKKIVESPTSGKAGGLKNVNRSKRLNYGPP